MAARQIAGRSVERVWGSASPPSWANAASAGEMPIGEIWFDEPGHDPDLLIKYLFTSEKLSIQVHPDDVAAHAAGLPRGKSEAWYVYDAAPGAVIGAGLTAPLDAAALRAAALDGSIEQLLHWRPVASGDFLFAPAGMIHAIGPGLSLIEIQQNLDVTYRLYDYGRDRPLQLDDALRVANAALQPRPGAGTSLGGVRTLLHGDGPFIVERWRGQCSATIDARGVDLTLIPIADGGAIDGGPLRLGAIWRVTDGAALELAPLSDLIVAYPGSSPAEPLLG